MHRTAKARSKTTTGCFLFYQQNASIFYANQVMRVPGTWINRIIKYARPMAQTPTDASPTNVPTTHVPPTNGPTTHAPPPFPCPSSHGSYGCKWTLRK